MRDLKDKKEVGRGTGVNLTGNNAPFMEAPYSLAV